jgi:glutamate synthase (NADPH/NADH) small chain
MGFVGPEPTLVDALGCERDARGNVATTGYASSVPGIFAAGDARRGQSLIVWAIEEGRRCAAAVDSALSARAAGTVAAAAVRR